MIQCIFVGLGGAAGAVLRYLVGLIRISCASEFPWKTLAINVAGSFCIGLAAAAAERYGLHANLVLFLKAGVCGGFTTFSTFALESLGLLRSGRVLPALAYISASILLSLFAVLGAQRIVG